MEMIRRDSVRYGLTADISLNELTCTVQHA